MIKRLFVAALLLALSAPVAWATVNIRQNSDGTADLVGGNDQKRFGNCLGGQILQIPAQLNMSATRYGVSLVSNAVIRGVYGVTPLSTTGVGRVTVYANQLTTPVRFFNNSASVTSVAHLRFDATSAGAIRRISTTAEVSGAAGLQHGDVIEGGYIAVSTDGGATGAVTAEVFVQVCPR